ncbi:Bifunctional cytochrome P450/NADPH--P450 reductase [Lachnellula cervina]|uniref:Bifunctional cytochrome P450/NADPH--P450 reductase n=1 Tax=Lachnellula cervina TaxID=1316786 RepID=A0A7D8YTU0_9HELO|nr:Bifunctional cytochrome P450/NADPH--P450 reductase [Lachnellula cervina]
MSCPVHSETTGIIPHQEARTSSSTKLIPIPQPPEHYFGLVGNLPDIDPAFPTRSFWHLADLYGPIVKLNIGQPIILLSSQELINEMCDQDRFEKDPNVVLVQLRVLLGDGLFTAKPREPNWGKAHRLLIPSFGPLGIKNMFDDMMDISSQMILKWDRQGPDHAIDCSDDFTRLAFDTIGLCVFSYRFNEFYLEQAHPFAQQMADVLLESGKRASRPGFMNQWYYTDERRRQDNVQKMNDLIEEIIAERKRNPRPDSKDLLDVMLNSVDRETGEKLSDENIRFNMCTFLVAGHETTSSTLSFCYYQLAKHPDKLHKAQREVDEVLGNDILEYSHIAKLKYIDACLKETLRLSNPISVFSVSPKEDTVIGGKYFVTKDSVLMANLKGLHTDTKVWGEDVNEFRPERMLDGGFQALPPNSWKPFGNGMRACIGRAFAEQEMIMNVALVLQRFQIELADLAYELQLKSTLTIKPLDFEIKVRRRPGKIFTTGVPPGIPSKVARKYNDPSARIGKNKDTDTKLSPITVLFGGNSGTCEGFAQDIESKAAGYGLQANVQSLDSATENLPTDQPIVIISASYEGKPPDNARKFVTWLEQFKGTDKLENVKYAVFGVGNSDWASTFHRIPKFLDENIASLGATRFLEAGYTDVKTDLVGPWEDWTERLWETLGTLSGTTTVASASSISVSVQSNQTTQILGGEEMTLGTVIANNELVGTEVGPAKKHMEVRLPEGAEYTAGDYLVVLPRNPEETVRRILNSFGLSETDIMSITGSRKKFLPKTPTTMGHFLSTMVELSTPITKRQAEALMTYASAERQSAIVELKEDAIYQTYLQERYSIIDVIEKFQLSLPFSIYIDMLQPLTPRQFSISSSPLCSSNRISTTGKDHTYIVSITYDVFEAPAWSGRNTFHGVASTFLASRRSGDRISCFVRPTKVGFRLPTSLETPIIMIAAGTGLAPMRAFIQERAAIIEAGVRKLGPATLFFGCRHEDKDYIYKDELREWEAKGVVEVKTAFSRMGDPPQHVQDLVWENRNKVADMFQAGAKIFLCGSAARLGRSAAEVCKKIHREKSGCGEKEADDWLETMKEDRYVSDVFG